MVSTPSCTIWITKRRGEAGGQADRLKDTNAKVQLHTRNDTQAGGRGWGIRQTSTGEEKREEMLSLVDLKVSKRWVLGGFFKEDVDWMWRISEGSELQCVGPANKKDFVFVLGSLRILVSAENRTSAFCTWMEVGTWVELELFWTSSKGSYYSSSTST